MAGWNGSGSGGSAAPQAPKKKSGASSPLWLKGALAGVLVVAIGASVLYMMRPAEKIVCESAEKEAPRKISEATPVAMPNTVVDHVAKNEVPYWEVDASKTNGFTREMIHKWKDAHRPPPGIISKRRDRSSPWHIFNHRSENMIASLLRYKPGTAIIGRVPTDGLTDDFIKSCQEPIIIGKDDNEYTQALKREMIAVKIALKERVDQGEDLSKIIEDTRDEYRKLSMFKQSINRELRDMLAKQCRTTEDVETLEAAANKMLEEKGIAPIKLSEITKERLLHIKGEDDL